MFDHVVGRFNKEVFARKSVVALRPGYAWGRFEPPGVLGKGFCIIMEYKLCAAKTAEELNKEVNKLLADGWALFGGPFVASSSDSAQMLCQALTKTPKKVAGVR